MKKKLILSICMWMAMGCLGGCAGQIPDMTEEQRSAISEYAVELLLKYDTSQPSRLVDLSEVEEPEATAEPVPTETPDMNTEDTSGMDDVADTPTIEVGEDVDVELPEFDALEETLLLPDYVTLEFSGYQVQDKYVDKQDKVLEIEAENGKKLLIFEFALLNSGDTKQSIDMLQDNIHYNIEVGEKTVGGMVTLLSNDLRTYMGEIKPDESVSVVLLAEVEESVVQNGQRIAVVFSRQDLVSEIIVQEEG